MVPPLGQYFLQILVGQSLAELLVDENVVAQHLLDNITEHTLVWAVLLDILDELPSHRAVRDFDVPVQPNRDVIAAHVFAFTFGKENVSL